MHMHRPVCGCTYDMSCVRFAKIIFDEKRMNRHEHPIKSLKFYQSDQIVKKELYE